MCVCVRLQNGLLRSYSLWTYLSLARFGLVWFGFSLQLVYYNTSFTVRSFAHQLALHCVKIVRFPRIPLYSKFENCKATMNPKKCTVCVYSPSHKRYISLLGHVFIVHEQWTNRIAFLTCTPTSRKVSQSFVRSLLAPFLSAAHSFYPFLYCFCFHSSFIDQFHFIALKLNQKTTCCYWNPSISPK